MKKLRVAAGVSIFFVIALMFISVRQFKRSDEGAILPEKLEYYLNENWNVISLGNVNVPDAGLGEPDEIKTLVQDALDKGECQKTDLPYTRKGQESGVLVFQNMLEEEYAGLTLGISVGNASVCVFLDGEAIYQHSAEEESEEPYADYGNYVDIPNEMGDGELWIELVPSASVPASLGDVKVESRDTVLIGVVGNGIADIGCCLLIGIMAIILFFLAVIRRYTGRPSRGEAFLGMAVLASGCCCFINTDTLRIFYDMQEAYVLLEYLGLLVPLFLTLYFERNLHTEYPRRFFALLLVMVANAVAQPLLHLLSVWDMEDMGDISRVGVAAVCVAAIISMVQFHRKNRKILAILSVIAASVLLAGGITVLVMHLLSFYLPGNATGQYSMAVFSILMAGVHTLQLSQEYRAAAEESASLLAEKVKAMEQQNTLLAQAKREADAARQEALAANEAKGKFLARMSHEIRTPINAVLGMDEMILREAKEQNVKDYAMDIYTAGQTLLSLINDILDFSKIDSGKMEIVTAEYDISSLIHDLANMTMQRARDKELEIVVEVDPQIPSRLYGDDIHIRQVLTNILTNAVKYTHEGTIWLRVGGYAAGEAVVLKFEVEDTGIGIKEEDLPKLSAEFERIEEDKNRNIEGTGLGMSITIQLLELLGSRLKVESVYGEGSKFSFELEQEVLDHTPVGDFEARVRQLAENYDYSAKLYAPGAKILVVDDNAVNRKVLRSLLKETQVQIAEAGGGAECLELVQKEHYDLIFLDHMMPEMDGVETLQRMKQLADYPCQDTPVVVLTANAVVGAKEKYLAEGFDDFLSKPIVPEKLENMMKSMLPQELLLEAEVTEQAAGPAHEADVPEDFLDGLPQVDGLDWRYAWLHLPDKELLAYTVREFYGQIDSAADSLEQAFWQIAQPEQLDRYRIQVHAMKSLAATVGLTPLSGVAKILENAAKDGKIELLMSMTAAFLEEWRGYREKLQGVFGIEAGGQKEACDFSVMQALVEMVRISMQEMDIDQADQAVSQLREYECPDGMDADIRKLAEAVTNLDVDETERLASLLIGQMEAEAGV